MNHHVPCSGVPPDDLLDLIYHYKALLIRQLHLWFAGRETAAITCCAVWNRPGASAAMGSAPPATPRGWLAATRPASWPSGACWISATVWNTSCPAPMA